MPALYPPCQRRTSEWSAPIYRTSEWSAPVHRARNILKRSSMGRPVRGSPTQTGPERKAAEKSDCGGTNTPWGGGPLAGPRTGPPARTPPRGRPGTMGSGRAVGAGRGRVWSTCPLRSWGGGLVLAPGRGGGRAGSGRVNFWVKFFSALWLKLEEPPPPLARLGYPLGIPIQRQHWTSHKLWQTGWAMNWCGVQFFKLPKPNEKNRMRNPPC